MYDEWQKQNLQQDEEDDKTDDDLEWENFVVVEKIDIFEDLEIKSTQQTEQTTLALEKSISVQKAIA